MRRPLPALAAAATAGLLVVGASAAPSASADQQLAGPAASSLDSDQPSALLRGTLRVLADADHTEAGSLEAARRAAAAELAEHTEPAEHADGEHDHAAHGHDEAEGDAHSSTPLTAYLQVGGVWVPLDSHDVAEVAPGSAVTVRVEVPAPVVEAVQDGDPVDTSTVVPAAEPAAGSAGGASSTRTTSAAADTTIPERVLDAALDSPAAVGSALSRASAVAAATSAEPVAADVVGATAPLAATVSSSQPVTVVAISMLGGSDSYYSDGRVDELLGATSDYWGEQTGGAVGFRRDGAVTRYSSSLSCSNPNALWNEAAQRAGFSQGAGKHLLLLLPPQAYRSGCSYGLGSVGASAGAGGVAYVSDASWPAIAHELGHNMSLLHADRLDCGTDVDTAFGSGSGYGSCSVISYGDRTDVMSSAAARADGTPVQATGSASAIALARLGVLGSGDRVDVTASGTTTWTVKPLSSLSGLRSVRVTDPRSGDAYDLEVRAATGRDTFGWGGSSRTTYGLRVLKTGQDGGSLLLDASPTGSPSSDTNVVVTSGSTFTSAAGGVAVRTSAPAADGSVTAQVSVARAGQEHWASSAVSLAATRLQGADRYSTAATVSAALVRSPSAGQRVFVASGERFPDALAAGAAAGRTSTTTPVVLVPASGELPSAVRAELSRLAPERITVVGGTSAVDDGVLGQLRAFAGTVDRTSGDDRYATSAAAALQAASASGAPTGRPVYLATGANYPDALSGGAAAASAGGSLLLTDPGALSGPTAAALAQLRPSAVHVLGGTISSSVVDQVRAAAPGAAVDVLAGSDRYETAVAVARSAFPDGAAAVVLATGQDFPDALAGGPLAAAGGAPLLLVQQGCAPGAVVDGVTRLGARSATVLGGSASLSDAAASLARC